MKTHLLAIISFITVTITLSPVLILAQSTDAFNDAEIAAIAVTANQIDIEYAKIALEKSRDDGVLNFAETMIRDHNALIKQAVELVTQLGVTPQENDLSIQLKKDADKTRKMLQDKSRRSFDEAYIENEIVYHAAVIETVSGLLIPQADNTDLKKLLEAILPSLQTHLDHARMLKEKMKKSSGAY